MKINEIRFTGEIDGKVINIVACWDWININFNHTRRRGVQSQSRLPKGAKIGTIINMAIAIQVYLDGKNPANSDTYQFALDICHDMVRKL